MTLAVSMLFDSNMTTETHIVTDLRPLLDPRWRAGSNEKILREQKLQSGFENDGSGATNHEHHSAGRDEHEGQKQFVGHDNLVLVVQESFDDWNDDPVCDQNSEMKRSEQNHCGKKHLDHLHCPVISLNDWIAARSRRNFECGGR